MFRPSIEDINKFRKITNRFCPGLGPGRFSYIRPPLWVPLHRLISVDAGTRRLSRRGYGHVNNDTALFPDVASPQGRARTHRFYRRLTLITHNQEHDAWREF